MAFIKAEKQLKYSKQIIVLIAVSAASYTRRIYGTLKF